MAARIENTVKQEPTPVAPVSSTTPAPSGTTKPATTAPIQTTAPSVPAGSLPQAPVAPVTQTAQITPAVTPAVTPPVTQPQAATVKPIAQPAQDTQASSLAVADQPVTSEIATTAQARTEEIDKELATTQPVDINDPNAVESARVRKLQLEKERALREFDLKDEAIKDNYRQKLAENNYSGQGAGQALEAVLYRDQSVSRNNLHYQMERAITDQLVAEDEVAQAGFTNLFNGLMESGEVDNALAHAATMASLYPESDFWNKMANDPTTQQVLWASADPAIQAKKARKEEEARLFLMQNVLDPNNENQTEAAFGNWADMISDSFASDADLGLQMDLWLDSSPTVETDSMERFGVPVDQLPDETKKELFLRDRYDKMMDTRREADFMEDMLANRGAYGFSDENLEMIQANSNFFIQANKAGQLDKLMVGGNALDPSDPTGGPAEFLFTDWDGNDYTDANPYSTRDALNQNLDALWQLELERTNNEPNQTRTEFKDQFSEDQLAELFSGVKSKEQLQSSDFNRQAEIADRQAIKSSEVKQQVADRLEEVRVQKLSRTESGKAELLAEKHGIPVNQLGSNGGADAARVIIDENLADLNFGTKGQAEWDVDLQDVMTSVMNGTARWNEWSHDNVALQTIIDSISDVGLKSSDLSDYLDLRYGQGAGDKFNDFAGNRVATQELFAKNRAWQKSQPNRVRPVAGT